MEKKLKIVLGGKEVTLEELLKLRGQGDLDRAKFGDDCSALVTRGAGSREGLKFGGVFNVECHGHDGNLKWEEEFSNVVTNVGLNHILDILFVSATTQLDPFYVGLTDSTPTAAGSDTSASHAGWTEITDYDEATRQTYTDVRSSQSVSNTAAPAVFTIDASVTVGGAFLDSASTGTGGTLLCVGAFTGGDRAVVDDDTLTVTYTFTAADS